MEFWVLLSPKKNVLAIFWRNLLRIIVYLKKQGDLLNQLARYGLFKVHKDVIDNFLPFRPILSVMNTPTLKLAKFLVPILKSFVNNEYTVKYSFVFAEKLLNKILNFQWKA